MARSRWTFGSRRPTQFTSSMMKKPALIRHFQHHFASICFALQGGLLCLSGGAQNRAQPSVEFTGRAAGGTRRFVRFGAIEGRVKGARRGDRIVLFAQSGNFWWVQPLADQPFTEVHSDSRWKSSTHPGSAYAALLVDSGYLPPAKVHELPKQGGLVLAVAIAKGTTAPSQPRAAPVKDPGQPWIEFTVVPPAGHGNPVILKAIEGRVTGAKPGERIVLYAQDGVWWVQPSVEEPFTDIQPDSRWKGTTHPGESLCGTPGRFAIFSSSKGCRTARERRTGTGRGHRERDSIPIATVSTRQDDTV